MPDPQLLRAFRFRVALLPSAAGAPPAGAGSAAFGAAAGVSLGASAGASIGGAGGGVSASASVSAVAFAGGSTTPGNRGLGDGGFAECTGLDLEMDVQELQEGGRNDGVVRRVGRVRLQPIVLKRGMLHPPGGGANLELWRWIQDVLAGVRPVRRYDGVIEVMSVADRVAARWVFVRGLPAKVAGPQLNARTGEIAIEELHIAHEGLRLTAP